MHFPGDKEGLPVDVFRDFTKIIVIENFCTGEKRNRGNKILPINNPRSLLGIDKAPALPTEAFLKSGEGRVLDIGAGTGRSTIMVLRARPRVTMVASDLFGDSFDHHFGHSEDPREPLRRNLQAAGVAGRATIETADMRKLPFEAASFDAIVSAYAVDHLNGAGIREALAEAARGVTPGGEFLLMRVGNDRWAKFAYGPLLTHGGTRGRAWWAARMQEAGFQLVEEGTTPGTLFFLARR